MKSIRFITTTACIAYLLLGSTATFGQTTTHELGLRLFGLDDFDFVYKKGKAENRFTRFRLAIFDLRFNGIGNEGRSNSAFNVGLAIGTERRKSIKNELLFIHGFEPSLRVGISNNSRDEVAMGVNLGIGYVLGLQYDISEHFYANIELIPTVSTFYETDFDGFNEFQVNTLFRSGDIALSLVYRFTTTKED